MKNLTVGSFLQPTASCGAYNIYVERKTLLIPPGYITTNIRQCKESVIIFIPDFIKLFEKNYYIVRHIYSSFSAIAAQASASASA